MRNNFKPKKSKLNSFIELLGWTILFLGIALGIIVLGALALLDIAKHVLFTIWLWRHL